jgi:hypothetical protein
MSPNVLRRLGSNLEDAMRAWRFWSRTGKLWGKARIGRTGASESLVPAAGDPAPTSSGAKAPGDRAGVHNPGQDGSAYYVYVDNFR